MTEKNHFEDSQINGYDTLSHVIYKHEKRKIPTSEYLPRKGLQNHRSGFTCNIKYESFQYTKNHSF